jgi:hypothetical protein
MHPVQPLVPRSLRLGVHMGTWPGLQHLQEVHFDVNATFLVFSPKAGQRLSAPTSIRYFAVGEQPCISLPWCTLGDPWSTM